MPPLEGDGDTYPSMPDDQGNTVRRDSQVRVVHIARAVSPGMLKQVRVQASCNNGFHCDRMIVRNVSFSSYVEPMNEETEDEEEGGEGEEEEEEEEEKEEEEELMDTSEYNVMEMVD